jgi:hypothetical protein
MDRGGMEQKIKTAYKETSYTNRYRSNPANDVCNV